MRHYIKYPRRAVSTTYTPAQICQAYGFAAKSAPGSAKPIGIIELGGGFRASDIGNAFAQWGLPTPSITSVSVAGGSNSPGSDADGEVVLDIEVAAGVYAFLTGKPAPVRVYFSPNTDAGFVAAVKQAVADGCGVISISWGGPEDGWSASSISAFDAACAAAMAAGCTVFAASGDNDSGDGEQGDHVDFPASSPHVVGCGGTSKTSSGESVWNNGPGEGTGGGFSSVFARPTFQVGAPALAPGRMVPDVAGNADPSTGYQIFIDGAWTVIGGTSAVAPLYAGLTAALGGGKNVDDLWANPKAFTDITTGNNGDFNAAVGPDPCTGLGVPAGSAFAAIFGTAPPVTQPPPVTNPPPTSPPTPVGGPMTGTLKFKLFGLPITAAATFSTDVSGHDEAGRALGNGQLLGSIIAALKAALASAGIQVGNGQLVKIAIQVLVQYLVSGGTLTIQQIITDVLAGLMPTVPAAAAKFSLPTLSEIMTIVKDVQTATAVLEEVLATFEGGLAA